MLRLALKPSVSLRGLAVLVVDDSATNCRILHEMLTHLQLRPTIVNDGYAALATLEQARAAGTPFPLLLDAQMPALDYLPPTLDGQGSAARSLPPGDRQWQDTWLRPSRSASGPWAADAAHPGAQSSRPRGPRR